LALLGYTIPSFKRKIPDGTKTQTIRKLRKKPIRVGEHLYHYFGLRTKHCKKLGESICTETFFLRFHYHREFPEPVSASRFKLNVCGFKQNNLNDNPIRITSEELDEIARKDGFNDAIELLTALDKMHHDLEGIFQVIRWDKLN
jgi:hypothetical protein